MFIINYIILQKFDLFFIFLLWLYTLCPIVLQLLPKNMISYTLQNSHLFQHSLISWKFFFNWAVSKCLPKERSVARSQICRIRWMREKFDNLNWLVNWCIVLLEENFCFTKRGCFFVGSLWNWTNEKPWYCVVIIFPFLGSR